MPPGFLYWMRRPNRTLILVLAALISHAVARPARGEESLSEAFQAEDEPLPSLWARTSDFRLWSGYKDNVLLGNENQIASPFLSGGLDLMWVRLPIDSWEALFLVSGDYTRYLDAREVDQEVNVLAQAQFKKSFDGGWKAGLSTEYVYFNQVFDNSIVSTQLVALPLEGHGLTVRPSFSRTLGSYRLELELPATRQWFGQFVDNYWEFGPKLTFGREYGHKSDLAVYYAFNNRLHDTRQARNAAGDTDLDRGLQFRQHEFAAVWRHQWDEAGHWRSTTRLSLQLNEDNGEGFYDYLRPLIAEQLRYRSGQWELRAEARFSYYSYAEQRVEDLDSALRHKAYLRFNLQGERSLTKNVKVFLEYEHERALSNLSIDQYKVNTIAAGVHLEF